MSDPTADSARRLEVHYAQDDAALVVEVNEDPDDEDVEELIAHSKRSMSTLPRIGCAARGPVRGPSDGSGPIGAGSELGRPLFEPSVWICSRPPYGRELKPSTIFDHGIAWPITARTTMHTITTPENTST
jgi:hypothetical protein